MISLFSSSTLWWLVTWCLVISFLIWFLFGVIMMAFPTSVLQWKQKGLFQYLIFSIHSDIVIICRVTIINIRICNYGAFFLFLLQPLTMYNGSIFHHLFVIKSFVFFQFCLSLNGTNDNRQTTNNNGFYTLFSPLFLLCVSCSLFRHGKMISF